MYVSFGCVGPDTNRALSLCVLDWLAAGTETAGGEIVFSQPEIFLCEPPESPPHRKEKQAFVP